MITADQVRAQLDRLKEVDPANGKYNYQDFLPQTLGFEAPDTSLAQRQVSLIGEKSQQATAYEEQLQTNQRRYDLMIRRQDQAQQLRQQYNQAQQNQPVLQQYNPQAPNMPGIKWAADWRQNVVQLAKKELGDDYVWGAEGPNSFDCSGLTQYVYAQMGLQLPRVSADQGRYGRRIGLDALKPGDLVLWDNSSRNNGADHVAIYIGNGRIIEAPHPGAVVQVSSLYDTDIAWGVRIQVESHKGHGGRKR